MVTEEEMERGAEGTVEGNCGLRAKSGETPQQNGCHGLPVETALSRLGVESVGFLTVPRPNGTTAYLQARDFREPGAVFEGEIPPLFFADGGATRFYRPLFKEDPNDVNAEDNIATVSGEGLVVGVHKGNVLTVQVSPTTVSTAAGSPVQLTASAERGLPEEEFTYRWSFGDGSNGEGPTVSHAFTGSGTYEVRVTATGSEESGGESDPVEVVVGNPPITSQPGATTEPPKPHHHKPKGPSGKRHEGHRGTRPGGKRSEAKSGSGQGSTPTHGSGSPSHSPEPTPSKSSAPEPPTTFPTPTYEEPFVPTPAPEERSGGDSPEPPRCCSAEAPPDRSPRPTPTGELVEGQLVGDVFAPSSLGAATDSSSATSGSQSPAGAVSNDGVGAPAIALIVVALLGGGALFEWRRSRPTR